MKPDEMFALQQWADYHSRVGHVQARLVRALLADYHSLRADVGSLKAQCQGFADRIAAQAELLAKRAER